MLQNLLRYFKGYLRIRVSGDAVERFVNACSYKGIHIWNLSSEKSCYELNISISDFKKLKPVIRKTRTKVVIVMRSGFPFFVQKYNHRNVIFAGFFLFIIIIVYLSTFIWNIKIIGNHTHTTESLITFLESVQIDNGMKAKNINCNEVSKIIRQNFDDIIWVSTSISGSNLIIRIKENEDSKEYDIDMNEKIHPYNIVSDGSYQITRIIVRNGISNVKESDYVKEGDILVSGHIPVYNDVKEIINYKYCVSDADIYGKKNITYEDICYFTTYDKKFCGIEKHQYSLVLGKHRINLGSVENNYKNFSQLSKRYSFKDISFEIRSVYPYEKEERNYSKKEIIELLSANFDYYCQQLEKKGVVILKNNVKIYTWSDKAKATGILTVEMPIGQKVKSELIETGDHIDGNDGNNN